MSVSLNNVNSTLNSVNAENDAHRASINNPHYVTAAQVGAYTTAQADKLINIIWSASGQIATPCLVDDMVFYAAKRPGVYYGLFQVSLNGMVEKCLIGSNEWPNAYNSSTGPGFRASIYADWENATYDTIRMYAAHDGRIATWTYNRLTKIASGVTKYAVNVGGQGFMGRGWDIFGVGAGSNPNFYMRWPTPHGSWNNMNYYTICRNYYNSNPNGEKYYYGDYRYLGTNTRGTIRANDSSQIYRGTTNYPIQCGIGVKGNRAFYCYDQDWAIMHRFIVPGSGNCADDLFNIGYTNSTTSTAQLTHDQSFQVPSVLINSSNAYCNPLVQFDDQGNEVGIAFGTIVDDSYHRFPRTGICRWNSEWGTGK